MVLGSLLASRNHRYTTGSWGCWKRIIPTDSITSLSQPDVLLPDPGIPLTTTHAALAPEQRFFFLLLFSLPNLLLKCGIVAVIQTSVKNPLKSNKALYFCTPVFLGVSILDHYGCQICRQTKLIAQSDPSPLRPARCARCARGPQRDHLGAPKREVAVGLLSNPHISYMDCQSHLKKGHTWSY